MFKPGNQYGKGRPRGSKNTLPAIRDRLFRILLHRIVKDKDLDSVTTETLIKFASACLPKDMTLAVNKPPEINYFSNVPRPEIENKQGDSIAK